MVDSPKIATGIHELVITIVEDTARRYPKGELVFSIDTGDVERFRLMTAGLHLPEIRSEDTVTESFDDGFIVVRRDRSSGKVCGLQILRYEAGPASVPELMDEIVQKEDRFLFDAVTTVMVHWALAAQVCSEASMLSTLKREWLAVQANRKIAPSATKERLWRVGQPAA